jgi:hypothetical protein
MKWRASSTRRVGRVRLISGRGRANTNKSARKLSVDEIKAHERRLKAEGRL